MTSAPSISRTDDLAACHAIRRAVFIEEQAVPEDLEIDDLDGEAIHLLAVTGGRAVGTARILLAGETGKIGRVAVLADQRGTDGEENRSAQALDEPCLWSPDLRLGGALNARARRRRLSMREEGGWLMEGRTAKPAPCSSPVARRA